MALPRVDTAYIQGSQFTDDYIRWLANLVDTLNQALSQLDSSIASIDARLTAGGL